METNEALSYIKKKYECKIHPDGRSIIIYNISLKGFQQICKKLCCSGFYKEEEEIAVASNFGYYK